MKIIVAGDFAPRARLAQQIDTKNFRDVFPDNLRDVIRTADFSFVNFESPVTEEHYKPIRKCGPNLHCTKEAAEAIKYAGFTGVTLANNHVLDFSQQGLFKTIECCKQNDLDIVGAGCNLYEAGKILYKKKDGKTLAIINCCEHEFTIATETDAGANPLNPIRQYYSIQEAKRNADYVLVIVHGGHEHYQLPSPRMQETYRFFVDAGADVVVNHHQHCFSGYEVYKGKPIFYGLGNFCFDILPKRVDSIWNQGFMVSLNLSDEKIDFDLIPYTQYGELASVKLLNSSEEEAFQERIQELNSIISNETMLHEATTNYYSSCSQLEIAILLIGRLFRKLYMMGLLPSCIMRKKLLLTLNHADCESHRDKLLFALKRKIEE